MGSGHTSWERESGRVRLLSKKSTCIIKSIKILPLPMSLHHQLYLILGWLVTCIIYPHPIYISHNYTTVDMPAYSYTQPSTSTNTVRKMTKPILYQLHYKVVTKENRCYLMYPPKKKKKKKLVLPILRFFFFSPWG